MKPQQPKKNKTTILLWVIIGVVFFAITIFGYITLAPKIISSFSSLASSSSEYPALIKKVESDKKSFEVGETMAFGPLDITATSVKRNYTLTKAEQKKFDNLVKTNSYYYGLGPYFTKVTLKMAKDTEKESEYGTTHVNWVKFFVDNTVMDPDGEKSPVFTYINGVMSYGNDESTLINDSATGKPDEVTFIFNSKGNPDTNSGELNTVAILYKKVLPIVGTEGAPQESFLYTLKLWNK